MLRTFVELVIGYLTESSKTDISENNLSALGERETDMKNLISILSDQDAEDLLEPFRNKKRTVSDGMEVEMLLFNALYVGNEQIDGTLDEVVTKLDQYLASHHGPEVDSFLKRIFASDRWKNTLYGTRPYLRKVSLLIKAVDLGAEKAFFYMTKYGGMTPFQVDTLFLDEESLPLLEEEGVSLGDKTTLIDVAKEKWGGDESKTGFIESIQTMYKVKNEEIEEIERSLDAVFFPPSIPLSPPPIRREEARSGINPNSLGTEWE